MTIIRSILPLLHLFLLLELPGKVEESVFWVLLRRLLRQNYVHLLRLNNVFDYDVVCSVVALTFFWWVGLTPIAELYLLLWLDGIEMRRMSRLLPRVGVQLRRISPRVAGDMLIVALTFVELNR